MSPKPQAGPGVPSNGIPRTSSVHRRRAKADSSRAQTSTTSRKTGQLRLVLWFAVMSLVALALAFSGTLWFVVTGARREARRDVVARASLVATAVAADALMPEGVGDMDPERRHELDKLFQRGPLLGSTLAAEIVTPLGRVVYATSDGGIDPSIRAEVVRQALLGAPASDTTRLSGKDGAEVVVAAVPLRIGGGAAPPAALVVAEDYGPIRAHAREDLQRVGVGMLISLVLLYAAIFPILMGASRRLRRQAQQNEHQALHDALTGLPNRALFRDRVRQAVLSARRGQHSFALLVLDLDRFKEVNDALGQKTGDELLVEVGKRVAACLRDSDTVARLGGDQFGVLLPGVGSAAGAERVARTLLDTIGEPLELSEMTVTLDISMGGAMFPAHGDDDDALIQHADVARRSAKTTHGGLVMYSSDLDEDSARRLTLAGDLRRAISGGELVVHYQPKTHLVTRRVTGFEALVRWNHPQLGLLPPGEFIQIAEATGLIRPLTMEVLDSALRQCADWRRQGHMVGVAVNLSVQHLLDDGLPSDVSGLLVRHRVPAEALELEITEGTIMSNPRRAREVLIALSDMGVRIAIDDFGVGYSSLGYLSELPVDVLKIDRSFVMKMAESGHEAMIVRTTIDLGHNLGLEVVAEGVETVEVARLLRDGGCDLAQGFYFSHPQPAVELDEVLRVSAARQAVMSQPEA
jgi:diguanylate cyclase (GGDEF)-like protein